ncbi:MAG TPA: Holliday junction resolvase RecU [Firmicutes bacterium]|nr:Holliday junction resolvase RecU [Bacillota bacterium]
MINYPNGKKIENCKKAKVIKHKNIFNAANRGMSLESDINDSNQYYLEKNLCLITKRPTPINIVKVDYSKGARIIDAYFEKQSTTDYNGIYKSRYIDFEAKQTQSTTSFPLSNIPIQQIKHLKKVIEFGGIAFFIIQFTKLNETYLIDANFIIDFKEKNERHSIQYSFIKENGKLIKVGYHPRLDYLSIIDELYF